MTKAVRLQKTKINLKDPLVVLILHKLEWGNLFRINRCELQEWIAGKRIIESRGVQLLLS